MVLLIVINFLTKHKKRRKKHKISVSHNRHQITIWQPIIEVKRVKRSNNQEEGYIEDLLFDEFNRSNLPIDILKMDNIYTRFHLANIDTWMS